MQIKTQNIWYILLMYFGDGFKYLTLWLYFCGNSLAGSSLQVMGLHGSKNDLPQSQWSVMGGTGQLTMARGIITYNITQENSASRTFEICIYVYYTTILVSARCISINLLPLSKLNLLTIQNFLSSFIFKSISNALLFAILHQCTAKT
jgi:hypothetical protein